MLHTPCCELVGDLMHIVIVAQLFPPDMGGGATRAYNLAKGFAEQGLEVTVVSAFPHYPYGNIPQRYKGKALALEFEGKIRIMRTFVPGIPSKGLLNRMLLFAAFIFSALFTLPFLGKVDVVVAGNPNIFSFFPSKVIAMIKRTPLVLNVDDLWPEALTTLSLVKKKSFIASFGMRLARFAYHNVSLITPISPGYSPILLQTYGVSRQKIAIIRGGVNLRNFPTTPSSSKSVSKKFVVLYTGAFSSAYDFDQILWAAKEIGNSIPVEFHIQGGGELARDIQKKIVKLKLRNVILIEKIISRREVAKLMGDASVLILPLRDFGSPYTGISSKLYEYQAAAKPIICCADGEPAKYVQKTNSGIVVKPGDYQNLARAVTTLYQNKSRAGEMGRVGRSYVEQHLALPKIATQMMGVIRPLLKQR